MTPPARISGREVMPAAPSAARAAANPASCGLASPVRSSSVAGTAAQAAEARSKAATARARELSALLDDATRQLREAMAAAGADAYPGDDAALEHHVRVTLRGDSFRSLETLRQRIADEERAADSAADELERDGSRGVRFLAHASRFGFGYDRRRNHVEDRRGQPLAGVLAELERTLTEQRSVVNERTRTLMDTLVMGYRCWFEFRLRMSTTDAEGIELTHRLRQVGSGGEQGVPNYLLVLALAKLMFDAASARVRPLLFDEAFYGIDAGRRDQLLRLATDLGLQILVASPDQDGATPAVRAATTLFVDKDADHDVHLAPYHYWHHRPGDQSDLFGAPGG